MNQHYDEGSNYCITALLQKIWCYEQLHIRLLMLMGEWICILLFAVNKARLRTRPSARVDADRSKERLGRITRRSGDRSTLMPPDRNAFVCPL